MDLSGLTKRESRLQFVIGDYSHDGRAFIYVTDAAARAILVYDVTSGLGYRVTLCDAITMGCSKRDVLHPSLIRQPDGSGVLILSYLGGSRLFSMRTDYLQCSASKAKINDLGPKPRRMVMLGTNDGSFLFFRYEGESDIYGWDASTPFCEKSFIKVMTGDSCALSTCVMSDHSRGRMRVLQTNFPDFIKGSVGCGIDQSLSIL